MLPSVKYKYYNGSYREPSRQILHDSSVLVRPYDDTTTGRLLRVLRNIILQYSILRRLLVYLYGVSELHADILASYRSGRSGLNCVSRKEDKMQGTSSKYSYTSTHQSHHYSNSSTSNDPKDTFDIEISPNLNYHKPTTSVPSKMGIGVLGRPRHDLNFELS
jgi:hypothetical protein